MKMNLNKLILSLSLILIGSIVSTHGVEIKSKLCCREDSFFTHIDCVNDNDVHTHVLLKCPKGSYIVDPTIDAEDKFSITRRGELNFTAFETMIAIDQYCLTYYYDHLNKSTRVDIAMVCFEDDPIEGVSFFLIKGILMFVSVFFLLITLYIYLLIPDMRETQDKVTCIAIICLTIFMFLLGTIQIVGQEYTFSQSCIKIAYVMYFFLISHFSWLNIVMANVWKSTVLRTWKVNERIWYYCNHLYAWIIAMCCLLAIVYINLGYTSFGQTSCWFSSKDEQWYFVYLPISLMIGVNVILFIWSCLSLHHYGDDISVDRKKSLKYKTMLYLKLFMLAGLTWISEVMSFNYGDPIHTSWTWIIVDVINCLHGVLIFVVLILMRSRIKRELAGRSICFCYRAPLHWSEVQDDEQEVLDNAFEEGRQMFAKQNEAIPNNENTK